MVTVQLIVGQSDIDDQISALMRESTTLKDEKRMHAAVACLYKAKTLMLESPFVYTAEKWCKLPLYLQQAGMFSESMHEFQFLLDDLPRRVRRDTSLDDPNVDTLSRKQKRYKRLLDDDTKTIEAKRALAKKRQEKRVKP
ncbi:hypothetical protein [Limnohabitans sp.]|uniref:hypothetical protein n=1 Tax=Limnohabitans sp. TaxID=1907725 RepID=UPI00286EDBBC|nr:hypothetical protein [Limnohabitans sp.]